MKNKLLKISNHKKILIKGLFIFVLMVSCKENKLPDFVTGLNDTTENQNKLISTPLKKIRFLPNWNLNSQFAAYYVGKEKGIYQKRGIDIEILTYNTSSNSVAEFNKNNPDFCVSWLGNALEINNNSFSIVNIAQFSNKSSIMMVSKKKSNIKTINDFNNKKIAIWSDFLNQADVFFRQNNIVADIVPISNSLSIFYSDGVEIVNANYFDEYHSIINSGYNEKDLNFIFLADYNFNLLEDGLYCNVKLLKTDPKLCSNFLSATIESWEYVFNNKKEAIEIIEKEMKLKNKSFNKAHQIWMLNRYEEIYKNGNSIRLFLSEKDYNNNANILLKGGLIKKIIPYKAFFQPFLLKNEKD